MQVIKPLASHHVLAALLCRLSLFLCFPQTHAMCSQHLWLYHTMHKCHVGLSCSRSPPRRRAPVREPSPERPRVRRPRGYRRKASSLSASPARYTPQPPQEHEPQPAPKPQPTGTFLWVGCVSICQICYNGILTVCKVAAGHSLTVKTLCWRQCAAQSHLETMTYITERMLSSCQGQCCSMSPV